MAAIDPMKLSPEQYRVWRQHHKADGTEKIGYVTHAEAIRAHVKHASWLNEHFGSDPAHVEAYCCDFCGQWHVGRSGKSRPGPLL